MYKLHLTALICLAAFTFTITTAQAKTTKYDLFLSTNLSSPDDMGWGGYATLDNNNGSLKGTFCVVGRQPISVVGKLTGDNRMNLTVPRLKEFGARTDKFDFEYSKDFGWSFVPSDTVDEVKGKPALYDISLMPRAYAPAAPSSRKSKWSKMDMAAAFREELRDPTRAGGDGGLLPSLIAIEFTPERAIALNAFLPKIGAKPLTEAQYANPCQVEDLRAVVHVVPFLEAWSTQKIKDTGLVRSADLILPGAGPGTLALTTDSKKFMQVVAKNNSTLHQRDAALAEEFKNVLIAFAKTRYGNFPETGTITRLYDNTPLMYRFEIVGRGLSRCEANRWEKTILQMFLHRSLTDENTLGIVLQIQEGKYAYSSSGRPSDARFDENAVPDGDLSSLQERFASYLIGIGFGDMSPGVSEVSITSCVR